MHPAARPRRYSAAGTDMAKAVKIIEMGYEGKGFRR